MEKEYRLAAGFGTLKGLERNGCREFFGVPFAKAGRFEYAVMTDRLEGEFDATKPGQACPQYRTVDMQLENKGRLFYHREFRDGQVFDYGEDCLNLNIFTPSGEGPYPVIVFFYGGSFNSGANSELPFAGEGLARRGIVTVFANYRVGILGYMTHEAIKAQYGREGNFGLDDQRTALLWVKAHIADFGGDPDNVTAMGQSAGAMSVQFLCVNQDNKGLFRHAFMMSGAGCFPKFALPKRAEDTRGYWLQVMEEAACNSFDELKAFDVNELMRVAERFKLKRRDTQFMTMPVIDGALLPGPVDRLIKHPLDVDYMIGYTNNDMYAPALALVGDRFGKANGAYIYYFDIDSPGDGNKAFHSCDVRYVFEQLDGHWRPYGPRDYEASEQLAAYAANFAKYGDPNGSGLPVWKDAGRGPAARVLRFGPSSTEMGKADYAKMALNFAKTGGWPVVDEPGEKTYQERVGHGKAYKEAGTGEFGKA